jgi:hypothetical protein
MYFKGGSADNYIYAEQLTNHFTLVSAQDINLTATSNVKIPYNVPLYFGTGSAPNLESNDLTNNLTVSLPSGNFIFNIQSGNSIRVPNLVNIILTSTDNERIYSDALHNIHIEGGQNINFTTDVGKYVNVNSNLSVSGDLLVSGTTTTLDTQTLLIEDNLIVVNSAPASMADGGVLVKRYSDGISVTTGNTFAGVFYKESTDEFTLAYTSGTSPSTVSITDYIPLRAQAVHLVDTTDAPSFSSGSLTTLGGGYINKNLVVGESISAGTLNVSNMSISSTTPALNLTTGALIVSGGITIQCSTNAVNASNGGGVLVAGGVAISKDLYVGNNVDVSGNTSIGGSLLVDNMIIYEGGGLLQSVTNTSSASLWSYLGAVNDTSGGLAYCDISIYNGVASDDITGTRIIVSINGTNVSSAHSNIGNLAFDSLLKPQAVLYKDTIDQVHLFVQSPGETITNIHCHSKSGGFDLLAYSEGLGVTPNGTYSGYTGSWTQIYTTSQESNLKTTIGDLTVEGDTLKIQDPLPIIGYNNINTTSSRDIGIRLQRYQLSNDSGAGDVVGDVPAFTDTIPDQTGLTTYQIQLSTSASALNDYYNGWWVHVGDNNQVRHIIDYIGSSRLAVVEAPFNTANSVGNTVDLYNSSIVACYYDEAVSRYRFGYTNDTEIHTDIGLQTKDINVTGTSSSSIYTVGGITIDNTQNAVSSTFGGSLTSYGGAGFSKSVVVGQNIAIGTSGFSPEASLDIRQTSGTIRLEGSYTYIDFKESLSGNAFGIINKDNMLALTYTSTSQGPTAAAKAFVLTSSGNVGISATSGIMSPLTIGAGNFISVNSNDTFLGLIGGASNTDNSTVASRIVLYGNDSAYPGNVGIYSGTSGSINVYTDQDTKQFEIDSNGIVSVYSTHQSQSSTTGAFIIQNGGIGVNGTENATNSTIGGAMTIAGGGAVGKDLYIGGNLYVTGTLNSDTSVISPTITFSNTQGCTFVSSSNKSLMKISNEILLSFAVEVQPISASQNCQIEFSLPQRTSALTNRLELVATCTGYTDDTNIIPLFNTVAIGVTGQTRGLLKFQSVSNASHYFTIMCRYTST